MSGLPHDRHEVDPSLSSSMAESHADDFTKTLTLPAVLEETPKSSSSSASDELFSNSNPLLDPHALLRLIQCPRCAQPLRFPLRLPCGYTLCRSCLPPVTKREGISYPGDASRSEGFTCYWKRRGCGTSDEDDLQSEHSLGDCGVDVTLSKLVEIFDIILQDSVRSELEPGHQIKLTWTDDHFEGDQNGTAILESEKVKIPSVHTEILSNGRYAGIYALMKQGKLAYFVNELVYETDKDTNADAWDDQVLQLLRDSCRGELDCQVCYALFLDPLTSACGHTFCRKCVARVLDHSTLCPICRRKLIMPPNVQCEPPNKILSCLIDSFWSEEISARRDAVLKDENALGDDRKLPVFICTLSFPNMPTFLHVFEPRYRLMIRRALDHGGRKFGMVINNASGQPQGELGRMQFMQYGTVLSIDRYELLPDGRSLISAIGVSRFKILDWGVLDGYVVAKTDRVDDIPLAEEEALEAREVAATASMLSSEIDSPAQENETTTVPLDALSTQQLLQLGLDFVEQHRAQSAPWLHQRVLMAYGEPPTDAAQFPYWLASVLPISEEEKYTLLPVKSVRERLKMTARWIRKLENMEWSVTWIYFPLY
jgi:Lon protease-like protein